MFDLEVKRLILAMSIQAEIEGMKATNKERELQGSSLAYTEADFAAYAEELRVLAYKHEEEW